jgi:HAMP domain-containing protein
MKMLGFLDTRIGQRFLAILLCSSLLPLLAMGWYAIKTSENALHQQNLSVLRASSSAAEAQLREFLFHLKLDTLALSNDIKIHDALADGISTADQTELEKLLSWRMGVLPEALEAIVIDGDGKLVASTDERRIVKDFGSAVFFAKGQASYFPGELTRDKAGQISWIMSAPVRDNQMHRLLGVVALRIDPESLSTLTSGQRLLAQGADTQSLRIGDTGETYIVDRSGFMITQSRSFTNAILRRKVDTLPVQAAKGRNEEIVADYKDYRGVAVSGASALIRDMGWVVLTEIDFTQAFGPFLKLRRGLLWLAAGLCIITGTLAWHTARWIVRPLQILKTSDQALAAGDASGAIVPEHDLPNDELGMFVRQRNARVKALLEHQQQLILEQKRRADLAAELEHMSYSIIHDMRAPLRAMIGFAEMIETGADERLSKADRAQSWTNLIKKPGPLREEFSGLCCDLS